MPNQPARVRDLHQLEELREGMTKQTEAADQLSRLVMTKVGAETPSEVDCPRAKTFMTPCVARDGGLAVADDHLCVGCRRRPTDLLKAMVNA